MPANASQTLYLMRWFWLGESRAVCFITMNTGHDLYSPVNGSLIVKRFVFDFIWGNVDVKKGIGGTLLAS